jgi:hypothetical protein
LSTGGRVAIFPVTGPSTCFHILKQIFALYLTALKC